MFVIRRKETMMVSATMASVTIENVFTKLAGLNVVAKSMLLGSPPGRKSCAMI